ncbi:MAG: hypothetical protein RJA92_1483, partial [Bacteroidota bacterium]
MKRIYIVLLILMNAAIITESIAQQVYTKLITTAAASKTSADTKTTARILKLANKQMGLLKYAYAIPLYKNYLHAGGMQDTLAYKNLGYAYRLVNKYDSALLYYTKASDEGAKIGNVIAELSAQLGNYKKAIKDYQQINNKYKNLLNDSRIFGFSNPNNFYADSLDYTIYYTKLNSPYNDFNAVPYREGLVFESNRVLTKKRRKQTRILSREFGWDGAAYSSLYYVENIKQLRVETALRPVWKEKHIDDRVLSKASSNDTRLLDKPLDYTALSYRQ